ncbi:MAG: hypothetical protein ACYC6Y_24345 [Thermoguttaceae bacterium]
MRLLLSMLVLGLALFSSGCGGSESSYKDREVDVNAPENVAPTEIPPPAPGQ